MKVIIALELEGRITRSTLDLIISKSFTTGANRTFLNEQNRALMLVSEDGKFADSWLKCNAGADLDPRGDPGAPIHSSSLTEVLYSASSDPTTDEPQAEVLSMFINTQLKETS